MSKDVEQMRASDGVVPKLCGSDVEVGNFILRGGCRAPLDAADAARALLAQVQGHARQVGYGWSRNATYYDSFGQERGYDDGYSTAGDGYRPYAQDYGRKFLPGNGGCAYIDLHHLELCTPECRSAFDHLAASRAMLLIGREAMDRANEHLPADTTLKVLANNSDGQGHSYGSHLNFLVTRQCFDNILHRKMHFLQFLGSFQAAAIVLTGAGKVGSENGMDPVKYQISSRADFIETMVSEATTYRRPLVNARDESLTGEPEQRNQRPARLHVIMFDHVLCHHAALLRVGMMQVVLCMIEQQQAPAKFMLDEPVAALHQWSRDPDLNARAALVGGRAYTAVDLLSAIYEKARRFVDAGRAEGLVPQVGQIMNLWGECLDRLRRRDMDYLSERIDWVAKRHVLQRAASRRGGADPMRMKYLDNLWSSLDPDEGLYWALEKAGAVQKLVDDALVERFVHEPPQDTRAWLRAWALRNAADVVDDVDWDMLRLPTDPPEERGWPTYQNCYMPDPLGFTRARCQSILESAASPVEGLRALLSGKPSPDHAPAGGGAGPLTAGALVKTYWPLARSMRAGASDNSSFHKGA